MLPDLPFAPRRWLLGALAGVAVASGAASSEAAAQIGPQSVDLINRLCAQTLRANEEDRLYGLISLTVRGTMTYRGATFEPDVIDRSVQNSLDSLIEDCPELTEAEPDKRLVMTVEMISDATTKVLQEPQPAAAPDATQGEGTTPGGAVTTRGRGRLRSAARKPLARATAADLSEELSSQEIDQWLDSLPPRQRALSLFLYASDVTPEQVAEAVGEPPGAVRRQDGASKTDLLRVYHEDWQEPPTGPRAGPAPAMTFSESGDGFAALMKAAATPPPATGTDTAPPAAAAPADGKALTDGALSSLKVTGISSDLYAGWSLLATARDLPAGQRVAVTEPFLLDPDNPAIKRMLVTGVAEIGDPNAPVRRFLLKAYAIDAGKDAAGLRDGFHVGAPLTNEEARKTLANPDLSSIEIARCLWHDFGTGPDPGLCRQTASNP